MSIEAFMNKLASDREVSNYDILQERMRLQLAAMDSDEIASRTGLPREGNLLHLQLLNQSYEANLSTGELSCPNGAPVSANAAMIIYDLLGYSARDAFPSGQYTQLQNLAGTHTSSTYAGHGFFERVGPKLDACPERLTEVLERLGGEPYGKGDISYRIPVFKDLMLQLTLWHADDEFPASFLVMPDKNTLSYLHYETVWYLAIHITDTILSGMKNADSIE